MTTYQYKVQGIDCANCSKELEEEIARIKGVSEAHIEFGMTSVLTFSAEKEDKERIEQEAERIILEDEKDAVITEVPALKHCEYVIESIDCAACAKELEEEISEIEGVHDASIDFGVKSLLKYDVEPAFAKKAEEKMMAAIREDQGDGVKITRKGLRKKTYEYNVESIDCSNCAEELREEISKIEGVEGCTLDFGIVSKLKYTCPVSEASRIEAEMKKIIIEDQGAGVSIVRSDLKHPEKEAQEEEEDNELPKLIIGAVLFVAALFLKGNVQAVVSVISYLVLGYDVLLKAVRNIGKGQVFDEHFLMAVATIAALYLRDYREAAGVMLFYQIGEYFQDMAVRRSRKSIGNLMDIRPDYALVKRENDFVQVDPEEVEIGDVIRVKPGEKIPLDGVIIEGSSSLNTASLTGESKPRDVDVNDEVMSGCVNESGVLLIRVTKEFGESTVSKILELVENNESSKAQTEKFITKFSRYYTPAVVFSAIAVAIIVGIVTKNVNEGIYRACTFLVISCPCALVISIPLSFFAGIGGLSSRGVLVKGANVIETLAKLTNVVMDKTGTLTSGTFGVSSVHPVSVSEEELIRDAAYAEHYSNHPIAEGIRKAYGSEITDDEVSDAKEIAGRGLQVKHGNDVILAGNQKLMEDHGIACEAVSEAGTIVHVARNEVYEGYLVLEDQLKEDAVDAVKQIHEDGRKVYLVSGDSKAVCEKVGKTLHMDGVYGECMPEDKVNALNELKKQGLTAFVGDGVNDAPVLACADASFAMGALGSDAAIEAADVVLMDDQPSKISLAINASRRILMVANENIYGAITIKILTLILGAFGIANMWMAIFADTGVAMLCVLNSMRLLHIARK